MTLVSQALQDLERAKFIESTSVPTVPGVIVLNPDGSNVGGGSSGSNASVGLNAATAPTSSTEVGWIDGSGNLQGVSAANPLPVSATISGAGLATSANQTNKSQVTQIADSSGNIISSTSNALNVDVTNTVPVTGAFYQTTQPVSLATNTPTLQSGSTTAVTQATGTNLHTVVDSGTVTANAGTNLNTSLLATSANLTAGTQKTQIVDGSGNVIGSTSNALNVDITSGNITGFATSNAQTTIGAGGQSTTINDGTNTANVVVGDTGFNGLATASASKTFTWTSSGTGIQDINITPIGGGAANTYVDCRGYNTISIITTVVGGGGTAVGQFSATSGGTYTTVADFQSGSLSGSPAGFSFSAQYLIGQTWDNFFKLHVTALTSGTYSGTLTLSNRPMAHPEILANQSGTWAVQVEDGSSNKITSNSTTYSSKFGLDNNLLGTLGTAFSTAGKVDVKGADGDVFVRQTTAANLNATVVGTGTLATQASAVISTSGGATVATGSIGNTATAVKTSAGQVYGWFIGNNNSAVSYVQFYNLGTGSITVGTTAPVYSLMIPANGSANIPPGTFGLAHSTAISIACTTTRAGATSPSNTVDYNIWYA